MYNKNFVWFMAAVAATGGLLFGFDTGVISGAIPFMKLDFKLDDSQVENITTLGLIGAVVGALVSGWVSDKAGRKNVILVSAIVFLTGALWCGFATSIASLLAARFYLGLAIGIASFATPLYIAEISPAKIRGTLVSMFQLLITVGLLAAFLSDSFFADNKNVSSWRPMFYVGVVPALILLIGMFFLPESPRWLLSKGREAESRHIMEKTEDPSVLESEMARLKKDILEASQQMSFGETFRQKWMVYPLMLAICIMLFQQAVGINTIIYYGPSIFLKAGFEGNEAAIMASVSVGVINVIFTILSLFVIDKLGRRKLYFLGMGGIFVSLLLIAGCFAFLPHLGDFGRYAIVGAMLLYIAFFAVSMGPLAWVLITEVFPMKVRGVGSSIGSLSNWLFNSIVVWTFFKVIKGFTSLLGSDDMGTAGAFCSFALVAAIGLVWGIKFLPETKGMSLEDIEKHWKNGGKPADLGKQSAKI
jgi:sugar porter (SP) family MFS transporter